jgi:flagellar capping protein FliD
MNHLPLGSMLFSIQSLYPKELERIDLPASSQDIFQFVEIYNEEFCEISSLDQPSKEKSSFRPESSSILHIDLLNNAVHQQEEDVTNEPSTLSVDEWSSTQVSLSPKEEKYTPNFYMKKLEERIEESREQQTQYERWDQRSQWWISHPDEFMIALQQHNLESYINELFSPSGTLIDTNYSLVRYSTYLDRAIQELNETYDAEQEIGYIAIQEDDDQNVDEELQLLLA